MQKHLQNPEETKSMGIQVDFPEEANDMSPIKKYYNIEKASECELSPHKKWRDEHKLRVRLGLQDELDERDQQIAEWKRKIMMLEVEIEEAMVQSEQDDQVFALDIRKVKMSDERQSPLPL